MRLPPSFVGPSSRLRYVSDFRNMRQTLIRSVVSFFIYWALFRYVNVFALFMAIMMLGAGIELLMQAASRDGKLVLASQRRGRWTVFHGSRRSINDLRVAAEAEAISSEIEKVHLLRSPKS